MIFAGANGLYQAQKDGRRNFKNGLRKEAKIVEDQGEHDKESSHKEPTREDTGETPSHDEENEK